MNYATTSIVALIFSSFSLSYSTHAHAGDRASDAVILLFDAPVKVTAALDKDQYEEGQPYYPFKLRTEYVKQKYVFKTIIFSARGETDAVRHLKKTVILKKPYLLVKAECGGGNAWRCNIYHVFKLKKQELVYVGMAFKTEEESSAGSLGFVDIYDKLESNMVTSHADAPGLWIALSEKDDRFVADLNHTWKRNKKEYNKTSAKIRQHIKRKSWTDQDRWRRELAILLLRNAVTAKYCERTKELESIMSLAATNLGKELVESFKGSLSDVLPGELPQAHDDHQIVTFANH